MKSDPSSAVIVRDQSPARTSDPSGAAPASRAGSLRIAPRSYNSSTLANSPTSSPGIERSSSGEGSLGAPVVLVRRAQEIVRNSDADCCRSSNSRGSSRARSRLTASARCPSRWLIASRSPSSSSGSCRTSGGKMRSAHSARKSARNRTERAAETVPTKTPRRRGSRSFRTARRSARRAAARKRAGSAGMPTPSSRASASICARVSARASPPSSSSCSSPAT